MVVWEYAADDAAQAVQAHAQFVHALREVPLECGDLGAEIVFGELVSNVVKHAPGPISMTFEVDTDHAFLRVRDCGPGFIPHIAVPADLFAETGRGLFLAQQFCTELKVEISSRAGTCVSAVLPLRHPAASSST